jgi:TolA-binding protein
MNDFLLTVLSTAGNLESLIESKPTERGNVLSRFIGLEILKDKETTCKKMYSDWSKKLISNVYNVEDLKQEIKNLNDKKEELTSVNIENQKSLEETLITLKEHNKDRDKLIGQKITDIDTEIENVNPRLVEEKIIQEKETLESLNSKLKAYGEKEVPDEVNLEILDRRRGRKFNNKKNNF